jgi:hypothetical protein
MLGIALGAYIITQWQVAYCNFRARRCHEIKHDGFRMMVRRNGAREPIETLQGCVIDVCRLSDMADKKEQEELLLLRSSLRALGRALRQQPEFEQPQDVPDKIRDIVARLDGGLTRLGSP